MKRMHKGFKIMGKNLKWKVYPGHQAAFNREISDWLKEEVHPSQYHGCWPVYFAKKKDAVRFRLRF